MDIREYAQAFDQVEHDYEDAVAAFGIPFEVAGVVPAQAAFANGGDVRLPLRKRRWIAMARGGSRRRAWRAARASARLRFSLICVARDIAISASTRIRIATSTSCRTVGISWASLSRLLQLAPSSIAWR